VTEAVARAVEALADELGRQVTLRRVTETSTDFVNEGQSTSGTSDAPQALVEEVSRRYLEDGLAQAGDREITIVARDLSNVNPPRQGDEIDDRGKTYRVLEVMPRGPGSTPWSYVCLSRAR